ncbi:response regulator [Paraburkholderia sp. C35]|uniref:response regulator transcription factor n=1 Tax=Paraburkholderia sp. C35 TaxID=2126993 RepID=UPI000D690BD3|nr:response regulator [Paraburkholderia sp. C35]
MTTREKSEQKGARLYLVDDDEFIRDSLGALFRSRNVASTGFADPRQFLASWRSDGMKESPAVFLLDVRMPGMSGFELFEQLKKLGLPAHNLVIFLTAHGEISMAVEAIKAGAYDFLEKPFSDNRLVDKVVAGMKHAETVFASEERERLQANGEALTVRELEIAERIVAGKTNKIIAEELFISVRTVEVHRAKLFYKLNIKSAVELVPLLKK